MAHKDTQMKNYEDENRKLNRIVHEQKMTIHELQDEAMNSKVM